MLNVSITAITTRALCWSLACSFANTAVAQDAKPAIPVTTNKLLAVKDYARFPDYGSPVLSPNGKHLAVLVPLKEHSNLAVIDLTTLKSTLLTSVDFFDVQSVVWVGNDRLVFSLGQRNSATGDSFQGGGLFVVNRDGSDSRVLVPTARESKGRSADPFPTVLAINPDSDREILISQRVRSEDGADVYLLDVSTGRRTLITTERPRYVVNYILDQKRAPRVAISQPPDKSIITVWFRKSENDPWIELWSHDFLAPQKSNPPLFPLAFDDDNIALLVASNEGRDTMAVRRYDPVQRTMGELVVGHPRFDVGTDVMGAPAGGVIRDRAGRIMGFNIDGDRPQVLWADEAIAAIQAAVDKALPLRINLLRVAADRSRAVITSFSDRHAPEYLLYDNATRKIEPLVASMPWLKPENLAEMRPFRLKTRDGLEIPSYYFLPQGTKPGDKLPTVIHIHGGPHARADRGMPSWFGGYGMAEAQMLASRGYAVVVPNFRITPGFGQKIYYAGKGSIGRSMSEDHEDAAKWAVEQGFADPARICITGASYGGYATLRAVAKTPELFKCGVAGLVVSDLERQVSSPYGDTFRSELGQRFWREFVMDTVSNPKAAREVSPVHQADRIKAPLLIYAGGSDVRTPIEQTNLMVDALKKAGQNPEVIIFNREAHGFGNLENRTATWEKMLEFLGKHIGTGPTAAK